MSWGSFWTIVLSVGLSILSNYFTAKWALNATMYEQAMIGANDSKTPLEMRLYYLRIIAKWEGEPLTSEQQKEIAASYAKNPDATLESIGETNPKIHDLVQQMNRTSIWDSIYQVDKSRWSKTGWSEIAPTVQPPLQDELTTRVDKSPPRNGKPKADFIPQTVEPLKKN